MRQSIQNRIARIVEPVVRATGLEIWGIECIPSGRTRVRIYVDTPKGTSGLPADGALRGEGGAGPSIEQCALISRQVALALEAEDMFPHAYVLELSTPGFDRVFFSPEQLAAYIGCEVEVELAGGGVAPGQRRLRGRLAAAEGEEFIFAPENAAQMRISWSATRKVRLVPTLPFSDRAKPGKKKAGHSAEKVEKFRNRGGKSVSEFSEEECGTACAAGACRTRKGVYDQPQ